MELKGTPVSENAEPHPAHYASFVLRCWRSDAGHFRARLIDVRSGVSHPVADPAELPGLVSRLVEQDSAEPATGG
jgi:hypothetical protein